MRLASHVGAGLCLFLICACAEPPTPAPVPPAQSPSADAASPEPPSPASAPPEPEAAEQDDISAEELAALTEPEPEPVDIPWNDEQAGRIARHQDIVRAAALAHGVEPDLINAVIWVESKFDRKARGPAGARGMMQLMPKTSRGLARRLERKDRPYDPDFNIHAGTLYLSRLMARLDGDEQWALVAYNRGLGRALKDREAGKAPEESGEVFLGRIQRARAAVAASRFHTTLEELRELERLRAAPDAGAQTSESEGQETGGKNVGRPPEG